LDVHFWGFLLEFSQPVGSADQASRSLFRHAVQPGPIFTGFGNRPSLTQRHTEEGLVAANRATVLMRLKPPAINSFDSVNRVCGDMLQRPIDTRDS
jgi:hypothetical protein